MTARPHLLSLVFYLQEKRVKIHFNRRGTKFSIFNNVFYFNQGLQQNLDIIISSD